MSEIDIDNKKRTGDEVERCIKMHRDGAFAIFNTMAKDFTDFETGEWCDRTEPDLAVFRDNYDDREVAAGRTQAEAAELSEAQANLNAWSVILFAAVDFGIARGISEAKTLSLRLLRSKVSTDTYRDTRSTVPALLKALAKVDLKPLRLPENFLADGQARLDKVLSERADAFSAEAELYAANWKLEQSYQIILARLKELIGAHDFLVAMTGKEIPGLELSLLRVASSPSSSSASPSAPNAAADAPVPATTGL
jgi:hypothetical protein